MDNIFFLQQVVPFVGVFHLSRLSILCKDVRRALLRRFRPGGTIALGVGSSVFVRAVVSGKTGLSRPITRCMCEQFLNRIAAPFSDARLRREMRPIVWKTAGILMGGADRQEVSRRMAEKLIMRELAAEKKGPIDYLPTSLPVERHSLLSAALFAIGSGIYLEPSEFFATRTRLERRHVYALAIYQAQQDRQHAE